MAKKIKLLRKTSNSFLATGLILIFLSSIALYFYTKNILKAEVEEALSYTRARVENALKNGKNQYSLPPLSEVKKVNTISPEFLKDTLIYDPSKKEMELFREMNTFRIINDQKYQIITRDLVVQSKDILPAVVVSNILIFLLTFVFLFYFNTRRNLKLWSPFFTNLEQMKRFSLTTNATIMLVDSDVLEFSELKNEVVLLTNKVKIDYENLKQFTENVSHEIQTPLAIIQAKIDNFINEQEISTLQFQQITSIQKDIQRLKNLNKRIIILTKIDNNQFLNIEKINLIEKLNQKIECFKELEFIDFVYNKNEDLVVSMDVYLADILINNLISNAVKHNKNEKVITITTNLTCLIISNFGEKALLQPEKLFLRFYREAVGIQSTGLGLAIVKKICDLYGFRIAYEFKVDQHVFTVTFLSQINS